MPGEEETLYQKHISPRGYVTAAIGLQIKRCVYTYTHMYVHACRCAQMCAKSSDGYIDYLKEKVDSS